MDTAKDMIQGGEDPTIRGVSSRLGVSSTAVYAHFSGKDHLMAVVAEEQIASGIGHEWAAKCLVASGFMTHEQVQEIFRANPPPNDAERGHETRHNETEK